MIYAISLDSAHYLGESMGSMLRLRYKIFTQYQRYNTMVCRGMEWDQFDTPAAVYLLWHDNTLCVRGVARLLPSTYPYMLKELWPHLVESCQLPDDYSTWEISRLGVDRDLEHPTRKRVAKELQCACAEFGLRHGITSFLTVTNTILVTSLTRAGWDVEILGRSCKLGRFSVAAARLLVSADALARARNHYGIALPVLREVGVGLGAAA